MTKVANRISIGILGYGEIGQSLKEVYDKNSYNFDIRIKDLTRDDGLDNIDILNVCIPYLSESQFISAVSSVVEQSRPKVTIIHSTVAPGTTSMLSDLTEKLIVHSPVRGVHPNLYEGLMTFVKFIGSDTLVGANMVKEHLQHLGMTTHICKSSRTTELGKLLSTTYYGILIAWHGEMNRICKENKVSFDDAANLFNDTYNKGYSSLGRPDVIRPTLYPPGTSIGGHCILPNVKILKKYSESIAYELIEKYKKGEIK